jgi:hypothetical protein
VISCQPNALEIAYADPDDDEGIFNPETATRFFLCSDATFRIPPGNCYRLENHSKTYKAKLTWTIIKRIESKAVVQGEGGEVGGSSSNDADEGGDDGHEEMEGDEDGADGQAASGRSLSLQDTNNETQGAKILELHVMNNDLIRENQELKSAKQSLEDRVRFLEEQAAAGRGEL